MKVSLSWLQEYVSINMSVTELVKSLTMLGLEVESVVDRFDYSKNVVVGRIDKLTKHLRSERLFLCIVDCGTGPLSIVCGDKNVTVGMLVPVALSGVVMPNGNTIREKKIQGYLSCGILCSEQDLELGANNEGVMTLDGDESIIGQSLRNILNLSDFVLEIGLTPNRPDCSSMIGVAREIAAMQGLEIVRPSLISLPAGTLSDTSKLLSISVLCSEKCPKYMTRVFYNIGIEPSPFWLQDRLVSVGLKPVNNVVDITNFVMMETGQPLHAFDFDLLKGHRIIVDTFKENGSLETLDGKKRTLTESMLTVSDASGPVAIAGIIGGYNSRVSRNTKHIVLESAYFDPLTIRETSKKLGITTESSYRFERGVDPNGVLQALNRASMLILELTGAKIFGEITNNSFTLPNAKGFINLELDVTNNVLGTTLTKSKVIELLNSIGFSSKSTSENVLIVKVPSFRVDVTCPEDLMEEVARLYGYDNINITFPKVTSSKSNLNEQKKRTDLLKSILNGLGFSEVINYSFIEAGSCDHLKIPINDVRRQYVNLLNPISSTQSVLRTSLIPGILDTIYRNISNQIKNLMFFEIGKIFLSNDSSELPDEIEMLVAVWTGLRVEPSWCEERKECDFFDIKGALEELLNHFDVEDLRFTQLSDSLSYYMRQGHSAQVFSSHNSLGLVGELDSSVLGNYSIKQKLFAFEINLKQFYKCLPNIKFMSPIPKFPAVSRDATIIINDGVESEQILDKIRRLNEVLVEEIFLLDVFDGAPIQTGMKSISFRVVYRSHKGTLDDDDVNCIHKRLINELVTEFDALLPSY